MKWWKSYVVVTIVLGLGGCRGTSTTTSAVDTPETAQASTDLKEVSQMEQCTLEVTGMTCGGCSSAITKALEKTPGVTSAKVSLEDARAIVEYDPDQVKLDALIAAVKGAGFGAAVKGEESK